MVDFNLFEKSFLEYVVKGDEKAIGKALLWLWFVISLSLVIFLLSLLEIVLREVKVL